MTVLVGHEGAWAEWRTALHSARLHHAWLLTGPRGLGKAQFALAAAAELVAEPGLVQPSPQNHPDILVVDHLPSNETEEEKKADGKPYQVKRNITIDQVRRLQARLTTRPTMGSRRAVILDTVDDLEKNAANALLKSLEEPPQGTHFLLVSHRPGRLLPTIRSRCRLLRFAPLAPGQVQQIAAAAAPEADPATIAAAVAAGEGSPGAALDFVGHDLGKLHQLMQRILAEGDESLELRGALVDEIGGRPDRDRQIAAADLARAVLAGELSHSSRERQGRIITAHTALVRLSAQIPTYNFDPALLIMEIGALLAGAAMPREAAT